MEKNKDNVTYLTEKGFQEYKEKLNHLLHVEKPALIEKLKAARELGDLKENAEYASAKDKQGEIENEINKLKKLLNNVEIITKDNSSDNTIKIGSKIELKNLKTKTNLTIEIVGVLESDPFKNKISYKSPIAKLLLNKKVGEVINLKEVKKPYKLKILKIN